MINAVAELLAQQDHGHFVSPDEMWRAVRVDLGLPEGARTRFFAIKQSQRDFDPIRALRLWKKHRAEAMDVESENRSVPPEVILMLDKASAYLDELESSAESPAKLGNDEHVARMFGFDHAPGEPHLLMENYRILRDSPIMQAFMENGLQREAHRQGALYQPRASSRSRKGVQSRGASRNSRGNSLRASLTPA